MKKTLWRRLTFYSVRTRLKRACQTVFVGNSAAVCGGGPLELSISFFNVEDAFSVSEVIRNGEILQLITNDAGADQTVGKLDVVAAVALEAFVEAVDFNGV